MKNWLSYLMQFWPIVRYWLTKFGREAFALAKETALDVARNPEFRDYTDTQKRDYVVDQLVENLTERYGHIPGFRWVIEFAVQMAVGAIRQEIGKG